MRIVFVGALFNASRDFFRELRSQLEQEGHDIMSVASVDSAKRLLSLYPDTLDVLVLARESDTYDQFLNDLENDNANQNLAIIVASDRWSEKEFSNHQKIYPLVNAYLSLPLQLKGFKDTLLAIFKKPGLEASTDVSENRAKKKSVTGITDLVSEGDFTQELINPDLLPDSPTDSSPVIGKASGKENSEPSLHALGHSTGQPVEHSVGLETPADSEVKKHFGYLYPSEPAVSALPVGDAIVPGGAAHSPDMETMKQYLLLREQDVSALSSQLKTARERIQVLENQAVELESTHNLIQHELKEANERIQNFEKEKEFALEISQKELGDLRFQLKARSDKNRLLEKKVSESIDELENLKNRVRMDIRKIRNREKELENKLEILRKDSEVLVGIREARIIELKRKLDLTEFNVDILQDQFHHEQENNQKLREKLEKIGKAMKVAGGFLENESIFNEEDSSNGEKKAS